MTWHSDEGLKVEGIPDEPKESPEEEEVVTSCERDATRSKTLFSTLSA